MYMERFRINASRLSRQSRRAWLALIAGLLVTLLALFYSPQPSHAATSSQSAIKAARIHPRQDGTRLVLESSDKADFRVFTLENPFRVVVDIKNARLATNLKQLPLVQTPIKNIRHGIRKGHHLRIVLDVAKKVTLKRFTLAAEDRLPHRLVVDLHHPTMLKHSPPKKQMVAGDIPFVHKNLHILPPPSHPKRDVIVVVDAGHGGKDPGALGPKMLKEKDVVLAISRELAREINRTPGFVAQLVRDGDRYVPHRERSGFARKARADLFISIHADAFTKPQANGASVFALSKNGSSSETARVLAKSQNEDLLLGGTSTLKLGDKPIDLQKTLVDLSMNATLNASLEVGNDVLREMGKVTRLHKKRVEQATFLVLKSTDMPSILVETGFISNPREAKNLSSPSHRRKLARQIFKGISTYFERHPPPKSYIAWRQNGGKVHEVVISRGDTLSRIAAKYHVSVSEIRRHNDLKSDTIHIGQRIEIPLG